MNIVYHACHVTESWYPYFVQQPGYKVATPLSQAWNFCMGSIAWHVMRQLKLIDLK